MRSYLIANSPWLETGNAERWSFSGRDDRLLRDCLDQLDEFLVPDPEDRCEAAIVFGNLEASGGYFVPMRREHSWRERAWTIDGALRLAELLPDKLADLADDLRKRFSPRRAGFLGDAPTRPQG